jgi:hypothetical protein
MSGDVFRGLSRSSPPLNQHGRTMRVFKSFISVNFLEEGWDARDQFLIPVPLEAPIVVLYRKVISACRDPSHHAWRTYLELFQRLGVSNPRASLEGLLSNPPRPRPSKLPQCLWLPYTSAPSRDSHLRQ